MSDFMQAINRITVVSNEIAAIAWQLSGRPAPTATGTAPTLIGPLPGPMAQDRARFTAIPSAPASLPTAPASATPAPMAPAQATPGLVQVLSGWASQLAAFVKQVFASFATPAGGASPATGPSPASAPVTAPPAPAATVDAREMLFAKIPTGKATVYGFVGVTVSRQDDRILVSAGSFGSAAVIKHQGEFYYQENDKPPVRVQGVTSHTSPSGDMRFGITLDSGKRVEAGILADSRTLRFDKYTLTLR